MSNGETEMTYQCPSCGGFCRKSGCERENVREATMAKIKLPPLPQRWDPDLIKFVQAWGRAAIEADRQARGEPVNNKEVCGEQNVIHAPQPQQQTSEPIAEAIKRITDFIERRKQIRGLDQAEIMALDGCEYALLTEDLLAVCAAATQPPQQASEPAPYKTYVQEVPDHCDRIVWRNRYYHLPIEEQPQHQGKDDPFGHVSQTSYGWIFVPKGEAFCISNSWKEIPVYTKPQPQQIPEYTSAMGMAGEAYLRKFKNAHPLPAQFQWSELWQAMLEAAPEPKEKA